MHGGRTVSDAVFRRLCPVALLVAHPVAERRNARDVEVRSVGEKAKSDNTEEISHTHVHSASIFLAAVLCEIRYSCSHLTAPRLIFLPFPFPSAVLPTTGGGGTDAFAASFC